MRPSANAWQGRFAATLVAHKEGARSIRAPYFSAEQAENDAALLRELGYEATARPYEDGDDPSYEED